MEARPTIAHVLGRRAIAAIAVAISLGAGADLTAQVRHARKIPFVNHVVEPGDTLSKLSRRYYGDEYLWPRIYECNRWLDPNRLKVGDTICIPEPTQGTRSGVGGFLNWFGGGRWGTSSNVERSSNAAREAPARREAPEPRETPRPRRERSTWTKNPDSDEAGAVSWKSMVQEIASLQVFGRPFGEIVMLVVAWFVLHMLIQGAFTWFAAHMAFVKDVTVKKAWKATVQSETLAILFLFIVGIVGVAIIYVATAPPGEPFLPELVMIAEEYLSSPTGTALAGLALIGLYVFLGIRFIPSAFGATGGQGFAIVLLSVLIPHFVLLYLVGYRLGYL